MTPHSSLSETPLTQPSSKTISSDSSDSMVISQYKTAVERLIAAYQAYPVLKARLSYPGTLSHTFTEITNEGLFSGILKGSTLAAVQFSFALFPAVYIANKS